MHALKSIPNDLFHTAMPLTLVTLAGSAARLTDRLLLGHHSLIALAAVSPVFVLTGVFSCFIFSTISYSGTFVAHNYGQGRHFAAVRALRQGLWLAAFSLPAILIRVLSIPLGHPPRLYPRLLQAKRFKVILDHFEIDKIPVDSPAVDHKVRRCDLP